MLYDPLSWYSPFSRFGGKDTVISELNVLVSGYVIQFTDYHHHMAATITFSGWAYFVTLGKFWVCRFSELYHFDFAFIQISCRRPSEALEGK